MAPELSQQLLASSRRLLGVRKEKVAFEDAVFGPLFLVAVVQYANGINATTLRSDPSSVPWAKLKTNLSNRYPTMWEYAKRLLAHIPAQSAESFVNDIIDAYRHSPDHDPYTLSTLYIKLKAEGLSMAACSAQDTSTGGKVSGKELLLRTQFFTEPHMVRFLVRKALGAPSGGGTLGVGSYSAIIDPAAGSCNFLIGALLEGLREYGGPQASLKATVDSLASKLWGYELDPLLAEFGALNLDLAIAQASGSLAVRRPAVFSGRPGDELGFLSPPGSIEFRVALPIGRRLWLTNPPYLGRRMMSLDLKAFIKRSWPESKGDLCTAFTLCCLDSLQPGDVLGVVHQNALFHLSSLTAARSRLLNECAMLESVDLGAGAFEALSGEKANVSLSLFQNGVKSPSIRLIDLTNLSYGEKVTALDGNEIQHFRITDVDSQAVTEQGSLTRLRTQHFTNAWNTLPTYGDFASPMQGTSTGDNDRAVRFSWEVPATDGEWISASKGGGFAKWWGLNRYVVWWGRQGEALRQIRGSALRNIDKQAITQLVFSDTGTAGLNVRRLRNGQVFIASGPGIYVKAGSPYAHLSFLNSRVATYFIRRLNPKLTVSAGYLKRLPFSEAVAGNATLREIGERCVALKREILSRKLGSDDCNIVQSVPEGTIDFGEYFQNTLSCDLNLELIKLKLEAQIESEVHSAFAFSEREVLEINSEVGTPAAALLSNPEAITLESLDSALSRFLSGSLSYRNGVKLPGGIAADGALEAVALTTNQAPSDITIFALRSIEGLKRVRGLYLNDLLHKLVLIELGFRMDRSWEYHVMSLNQLYNKVVNRLPRVNTLLKDTDTSSQSLKDWLATSLAPLHIESFFGRPVLQISGDQIVLTRPQ